MTDRFGEPARPAAGVDPAVHLLVGLLAPVVGLGLLAGNRLAAVGAVMLALVSAVVRVVTTQAAPPQPGH